MYWHQINCNNEIRHWMMSRRQRHRRQWTNIMCSVHWHFPTFSSSMLSSKRPVPDLGFLRVKTSDVYMNAKCTAEMYFDHLEHVPNFYWNLVKHPFRVLTCNHRSGTGLGHLKCSFRFITDDICCYSNSIFVHGLIWVVIFFFVFSRMPTNVEFNRILFLQEHLRNSLEISVHKIMYRSIHVNIDYILSFFEQRKRLEQSQSIKLVTTASLSIPSSLSSFLPIHVLHVIDYQKCVCFENLQYRIATTKPKQNPCSSLLAGAQQQSFRLHP